jgi:hypothetical protein
MAVDGLKAEFVSRYQALGELKFYAFLLTYAMNKLVSIERGTYNGESPELEFLDYQERFMILYRREGEDVCLDLARIFRKASHKIYRVLLRNNRTVRNNKFLNLV